MITCKLCNTRLEKKHLRRDGSMLCPACGQIYWKSAVDLASSSSSSAAREIETRYRAESRRSTESIKRARFA